LSSTVGLEFNLVVELVLGVDLVLAARSEDILALVVPHVNGVIDAETSVLTVAVVVTVHWGGAGMHSGLHGVLVGFHHVEFWAVLASNSLGITVVESVSAEVVTISILGWGSDKVESSDASAFDVGEVNVELN